MEEESSQLASAEKFLFALVRTFGEVPSPDLVGKGSPWRVRKEWSQICGLRVHRAMRINSSTSDLYTVIKVQSNTTLCPFYFYPANGTLRPELRLLFGFDVVFYISKVLYNPSLAILFSLISTTHFTN